jgi:AcrR family transcriptional regulator
MPVPKGATLDPASTRSRILRDASAMLYDHGLDGIGVAELCARLGISRQTLYRHFGSKDGLVRAVLEARSDRVVGWLREAVAAAGDDPADQLTAVFDALARWYAEPAFRGCAIVNAAVQHHTGTARAVATRHLDRHLDTLTGIAARAGAAEPDLLGRQLLMLVEGATVVADHHHARGEPAVAARQALQAAHTLLRAAAEQRARREP